MVKGNLSCFSMTLSIENEIYNFFMTWSKGNLSCFCMTWSEGEN